jgi:hypothetical protein
MNLKDKIVKQEFIIEGINKGIDNLLKENWMWDVVSFVRSPPMFVAKKVFSSLGGKLADGIEDKKDEIDNAQASEDIQGLKKELDELMVLLKDFEKKKMETIGFNQIVIEFKKKVELDIIKLKSPEFQRNLVGVMYFKVVGVDETNRTIELKTSSFPDTIILNLKYETLTTYQDQKGEVNLIYSRYGDPDLRPVDGELEDCYFKIIETK